MWFVFLLLGAFGISYFVAQSFSAFNLIKPHLSLLQIRFRQERKIERIMQLTALLMLPAFASRKKYEGIVHCNLLGLSKNWLFEELDLTFMLTLFITYTAVCGWESLYETNIRARHHYHKTSNIEVHIADNDFWLISSYHWIKQPNCETCTIVHNKRFLK